MPYPLPPSRHKAFAVLLFGFGLLLPASSGAEKLYTYRDGQGALVFSDKPLDFGSPLAVRQVRVADHSGSFTLRKSGTDDNAVLRGVNGYYGPVQVEIALEQADNIVSTPSLPRRFVLSALAEGDLVRLRRADERRGYSYRYSYRYLPGDPQAEHAPPSPYRLPLPPGEAFRISQGFNGAISHTGTGSRYAVDIAMTEGTPVYAARDGLIMEVANDFYDGGFDRERYGRRANFVRILHDDGTMAVYVHLKLETVRYPPGARVKAGDCIAESGNTGYSSGPHLHFAIQKNAGMELHSLPFTFVGRQGVFVPREGMLVRQM